jgi:hypothetical protein
VAAEVGFESELVRLGLEYEVGNGGSRLLVLAADSASPMRAAS